MEKILGAGAALLLTTGLASAGGLDRSGQPVGAIFEEGSYAELSFGRVNPSVSGNMNTALPPMLGGGAPSGDMAPSYAQFGAAYKTDLFEGTALAIILDQPYGADVDYDSTAYALAGANAEVDTTGLTVLLRYRIDENFSLHGGVRTVTASGVYDVPTVPDLGGPGPGTLSPAYASTYSSDTGMGYVLGGSYERPEIALRVALTYSSQVDLALDGSAGDLSTTMPESVNLDFQTGIAQDTLLFGSMRYVAWDGFALTDSTPAVGNILEYDDDVYTFNIGVGRQFTDKLSASFAVGYEAATDEPTSNLGPTDGYVSYQLGAAYMIADGVELSGGIRYIDIGDATTSIGSDFSDNSAVGLGAKIAYSY